MLGKILGQKGQDVEGLFKSTIKLIGMDRDLLIPIVYIAIYRLISATLIFTGIYNFFFTKNFGFGFISLLAFIFFAPISSFLQIRHQAALAWMTFEVLKGKDTNLDSGFKQLRGLQFKLFLVALINFFSKNGEKSSQENSGIKEIVISILTSVLKDVWDLVQNFLVPALVIEKVDLKEAALKLKQLKNNIPAALSGVLAIDVFAGLISSVAMAFTFYGMILGGAIGYFGKDFLPTNWGVELSPGILLNLLPLFCCLFLSAILSNIVLSGATGLKSIYYSTFYVSLNHPLSIREDLRREVTNYLNFRGQTQSFDFFSQFKTKDSLPDKKLEISSNTGIDQATIDKLKRAFNTNFLKGHETNTIKDFLLKKGYASEVINFALNEYLEEETNKVLLLIKGTLSQVQNKNDLEIFLKEKGVPSVISEKVRKAV